MKRTTHEIIIGLFIIIMVIVAIACVVAWIVAMSKYGATPVHELPAWAYFILRGGSH